MYKIPAGTLFFGKNMMVLPECPSTNTVAAELGQSGRASEGTVVVAHRQTAGRGQRGNTWEAEEGLNLTFSVILYPLFLEPVRQFLLNEVVSLAIHDVVLELGGSQATIKWPNDIMLGDKKVCGILIENVLSGSSVSQSVVGIGLNVNQERFSVPTATSLSLHMGKKFDLPQVLDRILQSLEWRYLQLRNGQSQQLDRDYQSSLYRLNRMERYSSGGDDFSGVIRGVSSNGRLMIEVGKELKSFDLKEIKYL